MQHVIKILLFFSLFTTVGVTSILSTINKEYRKFLDIRLRHAPLQRITNIFTTSENDFCNIDKFTLDRTPSDLNSQSPFNSL